VLAPKPKGLSGEYAAVFKDPSVVVAYAARPPYPEEAIRTLASLIVDEPRAVLDVGCGPGELARRLTATAQPPLERVDAVDFSAEMLALGRRLPGGDDPRIRWMHSAVEDASLDPPYALITAGESLHWMEWAVVMPEFARALTPRGALAIVNRGWGGPPAMQDRLRPIYAQYSANRDFQHYDLIDELEQRGLFRVQGRRRCEPESWQPTLAEYLECLHSQNGCSRPHMGPANVAAFDAAITLALDDLCREGVIAQRNGRYQFQVEATVVWGAPLIAVA